MRLTDIDLKTYISCPMQYKLRTIDKKDPKKSPLNVLYTESLKNVLSFYYFKLLDQKDTSIKNLLYRWKDTWFKTSNINFYGMSQLEEFSNQGVFLIQNFFQGVNRNPGTPVAVNFKYSFVFERETEHIDFSGTIDLIRILTNHEKQLTMYNLNKYRPTDFEIRRDIMLSLYSLMFRKLFHRQEKSLSIFHVKTLTKLITTRSQKERDYVKTVIFNVADAIKAELFYPRVDEVICKYCLWKGYCSKAF